MVEPQFILGRLETILDRPAMTLERLFLSSRNFCTRCGEHLNRRAAFVKARGQAKRRREPQTRDDGVKPRILNSVEPMQRPGKDPHRRADADRHMVRTLSIQAESQRPYD